jgi:hypothetical protein
MSRILVLYQYERKVEKVFSYEEVWKVLFKAVKREEIKRERIDYRTKVYVICYPTFPGVSSLPPPAT